MKIVFSSLRLKSEKKKRDYSHTQKKYPVPCNKFRDKRSFNNIYMYKYIIQESNTIQ